MKKKIALISATATLIGMGILSFKSWAAGFLITRYLSGRKEGQKGKVRSIIISIRNHQLHLHHWIISVIFGGVSALKGFHIINPEVFYGFLSAITFQGIFSYKDWHRIILRKRNIKPVDSLPQGDVCKHETSSDEKVMPANLPVAQYDSPDSGV